jgi:membrane protein CcdC involved in cytochrome C biogenesis
MVSGCLLVGLDELDNNFTFCNFLSVVFILTAKFRVQLTKQYSYSDKQIVICFSLLELCLYHKIGISRIN